MEFNTCLSVNDNSPFLRHYGIPRRSGRYKWGSGSRPYQSLEGKPLTRREWKKLSPEERAAAEKRMAEMEEEYREKDRLRVLRTGGSSATEALRYAKSYDINELRDITSRVRMTKELEKYSQEERKSIMKKVDSFMKGVETVTRWGDDAVKAAATVKKFLDMFEGEEKKKGS